MSIKDRIRGCIVGLAVGDALGAPVEFFGQAEVLKRYNGAGPTELEESYGVFGAWTDDTQMSLATAEGLIRARTLERSAALAVDPIPFIYQEYLQWRISQRDAAKSRGPGSTCLSALEGGLAGHVGATLNNSKGCGGVMRVAPVGLVYAAPRVAWRVGCESAALTHSHPGGYLPAGFLAAAISYISRIPNPNLDDVFALGMRFLSSTPANDKRDHFAGLMQLAKDLAISHIGKTEWGEGLAARKIGAGWCGDEALALAFFFAFKHPHNFREAVQAAVLHSGDRDSVGSITGALMGALRGFEAVPSTWNRDVEDREGLEAVVEDLIDVAL